MIDTDFTFKKLPLHTEKMGLPEIQILLFWYEEKEYP